MACTLRIDDLERHQSTGLVIRVNHSFVLEIDGDQVSRGKSLELEGDPTADDYIPFENLTEETIKEWVLAQYPDTVLEDMVEPLTEQYQDELARRNRPVIEMGLPW